MFQNDSLVCFSEARTCRVLVHNDWRCSLDNRFHFRLVSRQTLQYAFRILGIWNELPGIILFYVCKKVGTVYNLLNGQVQGLFLFFDNVFICDLKK